MPRPAALYNRRKWQLIGKSQWCCSANCGHPLHTLTYNWTRCMQLANTPPLQSTAPGLHPVGPKHSPDVTTRARKQTSDYSLLLSLSTSKGWKAESTWSAGYIPKKVAPPGVEPVYVTHPSTNRARRRVTSLIRPTPLPLRYAANLSHRIAWNITHNVVTHHNTLLWHLTKKTKIYKHNNSKS